jgi:folate-binding protein YgfZ
MRVLELGDSLLLELPAAATAVVRDHLDRFVFTEDVAVADVTATRGQVGVYGPRAADVIAGAGVKGATTESPMDTMFASRPVRIAGVDAILVRSDRPGIPGFEVIAEAAAIPAIEAAVLAAGAVRASAADVEAVRIESGRPRFGADTGTDTIPLEAGLEDRAISRTKGCYVGQEVIVRVIDRGHGRVARRLVGLTLPAAAPLPAAGTPLRSGDKEIGRVTSAAFSPRLATPVALGYVQRDFVEPGTTVQIEGSGDASVASLPLVPLQ